MMVLLDTHVVLWAAGDPDRLGDSLALIGDSERTVSVASVWELAIKQNLGKVDLGESVGEWFSRAAKELAVSMLPVTATHAAAVEALPAVHRDPFDRLLVAQAKVEGLTLLTADRVLGGYGHVVQVIG